MIIVALSGWKGSGKDMVADYLVQNHGFERISFADPLKDRVSEKFGIPRKDLDDQSKKESPILTMPADPRDAFSRMVCEFMFKELRSADGDRPASCDYSFKENKFVGRIPCPAPLRASKIETLYWTPRALCILEGSSARSVDPDHWVKQAVAKMDPNGKYVISDVRFISELESLQKEAPGSVFDVRIERFESSPSTDPSERDLDNYPFSYRINNKSVSMVEVFSQVEDILASEEVTSVAPHEKENSH